MEDICHVSDILDTRGDLLIRGLWDIQTDNIINAKVGNSGEYTYSLEPMVTLLDRWDKNKKDNHGKNCHKKQKKTPFVLSVDVMISREALVVLTNLNPLMA